MSLPPNSCQEGTVATSVPCYVAPERRLHYTIGYIGNICNRTLALGITDSNQVVLQPTVAGGADKFVLRSNRTC